MADSFVPVVARRSRWPYVEMLLSAVVSLMASFVLSVDAVKLAADPFTELSCNVSAKLSCATVGLSWQASAFGFPNAFLGLIAESVVITVAVAALGGARFPRWFMLGAQAAYTLGLLFAYWLFFQSYFVIGALCPWCLTVTIATTLVFASMTRVNLREGNIPVPARMRPAVDFALRNGLDFAIQAIVVAGIAGAVIYRYL